MVSNYYGSGFHVFWDVMLRFCGLFYEAAGNSIYQVLHPYNGTEEYTDIIVRFTEGIGEIKHCELTRSKHVWNKIRS